MRRVLARWREARLEWAKDALDEARADRARAKRFDAAFGGRRGQIRRLQKRIDRLTAKVERLEPATEENRS